MTSTQLDLLNAVANGPEPWRISERDRVVAAIATAAEHGEFSANDVRVLLTNDHGLTVNPQVMSATFYALRAKGFIRRVGWTQNTDTRGRNSGKPLASWLWIGEPA